MKKYITSTIAILIALSCFHGQVLANYIDIKDQYGKTSLHIAAQAGDSKAVQALSQAGADINTVAPYWRGGNHGELEQLESCYRAIMREAIAKRMQSIAIPCIGTGAHKFPSDQAARIAVRTCYRVLREQDMNPPAWPELEMRRVRIIFCCFSDVDAWCYKNLVQELEQERQLPSLSTVVNAAIADLEVLR